MSASKVLRLGVKIEHKKAGTTVLYIDDLKLSIISPLISQSLFDNRLHNIIIFVISDGFCLYRSIVGCYRTTDCSPR